MSELTDVTEQVGLCLQLLGSNFLSAFFALTNFLWGFVSDL
jgi:hypothetical protein